MRFVGKKDMHLSIKKDIYKNREKVPIEPNLTSKKVIGEHIGIKTVSIARHSLRIYAKLSKQLAISSIDIGATIFIRGHDDARIRKHRHLGQGIRGKWDIQGYQARLYNNE